MRWLLGLKNRFSKLMFKALPEKNLFFKTMARFILNKKSLGSDLKAIAATFEDGYEEIVEKGEMVIDLKVLKREGDRILVQSQDGREIWASSLVTNSYNDLDQDQSCRQKLVDYVTNQELSSCLSRKIAGEVPIHRELQRELCEFMGYPSGILATSGYVAQMSAMTSLFSKGDVIFSDELNHSSLVDGMKLSGAKVIIYPHLNYKKLESLLKRYRHRYNCAGIVSDGVFSAHGTLANLDTIHHLKSKYAACSVIDDTHGFTVVGRQGRGIVDLFRNPPDVLTASLAKGLAGFGGVVLASKGLGRVVDCLGWQNINTSHLSPIVAAQCLFQLRHYRNHLQKFSQELHEKIVHLNNKLSRFGKEAYFDTAEFSHPIFSFSTKNEREATRVLRKLFSLGILGAFFPPPVAPDYTLRFSLHRNIDLRTLDVLADLIGESELIPVSRKYWQLMPEFSTKRSESVAGDEPTQKVIRPFRPSYSLLKGGRLKKLNLALIGKG